MTDTKLTEIDELAKTLSQAAKKTLDKIVEDYNKKSSFSVSVCERLREYRLVFNEAGYVEELRYKTSCPNVIVDRTFEHLEEAEEFFCSTGKNCFKNWKPGLFPGSFAGGFFIEYDLKLFGWSSAGESKLLERINDVVFSLLKKKTNPQKILCVDDLWS